jgi:hypothetical protein
MHIISPVLSHTCGVDLNVEKTQWKGVAEARIVDRGYRHIGSIVFLFMKYQRRQQW